MRTITLLVLTATGLLAAGCGHLDETFFPTRDDQAAARGLNFARQNCASCHEIGFEGASPRALAPAFGQIRGRFSATGLERELEAVASVGHYDMKPVPIDPSDRRDVVAYIESLKGR